MTNPVREANGAPLLADAGGTHVRLARLRPDGGMEGVEVFSAREYAGLEEVFASYLRGDRAEAACLAVAGPADGEEEEFRFTNLPWKARWGAVAQRFGFSPLVVMNDFAALALGALELGRGEWIPAGGADDGKTGAPLAVVGPGTGMGVAGLLDGRVIPCEGGHVAFAPQTEAERGIARVAEREMGGRVSVERLLSGPGLERIHRLHARARGWEEPGRMAGQILELGLSGADEYCGEVLRIFAGALGAFAGDVALTLGARGGCYIGGGIGRRMAEFLARPESGFRERFDAKGRLSEYVETIPVRIMTAEFVAMRGVARRMRESMQVISVGD